MNDISIATPTPPYPEVPRVSANEVQRSIDALRAAGVDEARIQAALAVQGVVETRDTRTPEEKAFEASFPAEPKAADYRLSPELHPDDTAEIRASLAAMRLPPAIGQEIAERALRAADLHGSMTDDEKAVWFEGQRSELVRQCGSDEAADAELKLASETLAGSSALLAAYLGSAVREVGVVRLLARQAERSRYSATLKHTGA